MFVVGLLVGPVASIVVLWLATDRAELDVRLARWGLAVILALVLVLPVLSLELRLGTVLGGFLGMLLASTPVAVDTVESR